MWIAAQEPVVLFFDKGIQGLSQNVLLSQAVQMCQCFQLVQLIPAEADLQLVIVFECHGYFWGFFRVTFGVLLGALKVILCSQVGGVVQ